MSVVKLTSQHADAVKGLFVHKKFMGVSVNDPAFFENFNNHIYNSYCSTYLSGLGNFHSYGYIEGDTVKSFISFYESYEEPAWYYTLYRSQRDGGNLRQVLDSVIEHNEKKGRLKFYTLTHARHTKLLRRFHWSKYNNERYGYFDEYQVPAKAKVYYSNAWDLLYKHFLVPEISIVRCNYLKQEYRKELPQGGNL